MSEYDKLWFSVWRIVGAVVIAITLTIGSCTANRHYQTRRLIENTGVDPIVAGCALDGDVPTTDCILRAAQEQKP